jgi:penicillin-binding protein 2
MKLFVRKNEYRGGSMEIDDAVLTVTEEGAAKIEWPLNRSVLKLLFVFGTIGLTVLAGRVFFLSVIKGVEYQEKAARNSLRQIVVPAPRGIIYDRFGQALVHNTPSMDAVLVPADVPEESNRQDEMKSALVKMLSLDRSVLDDIFGKLDRRSTKLVLLKERVSQDETLLLAARVRELPGVGLYRTTYRDYIDGLIFSHVLGYEGKIKKEELEEHPDYLMTDAIGKQGIEKSYEPVLRGKHGFQRVEVDALGQVKKDLGTVQPEAGSDLFLNIDADFQKKIFDTLSALLDKEGLKRAAAIAIDPRDGAVRAFVSLPSFDNNLFARGISQNDYQGLINDPSQPLFDRAISGEYPPGSTIKPVIAAAALAEGVVTPTTVVDGLGGALRIGNSTFHDWTTHGPSTIRQAIAQSNDIFFYTIGGGYGTIRGLGMDRMKQYENLFGYGEKSGIDTTGEADGFIPDPAWKQEKIGERWSIGNTYHAAIGQGYMLATPLQIVNSIAAIANGGTLYEPHIAAQVRSSDGNVSTLSPKIIRKDFIDTGVLQVVREGMRETVIGGTAQSLKDLPVEVAGKTGTAQFGADGKTHGWFVSFAPYDHPELAMIVLVEGQGEEGYNTVPVTKDAYAWYFSRPTEGR